MHTPNASGDETEVQVKRKRGMLVSLNVDFS